MRKSLAAFFLVMFGVSEAHAKAVLPPTVTLYVRPNADGNCGQTTPVNCETNLLAREAHVGRTLGLSTYVSFDFTDAADADWADANGRPVQITIQHIIGTNGCFTISDVLAGVYDTQLAAINNYIAGFHKRAAIRFIPELNKAHQACIYQNDPVAHPELAGPEFQELWTYFWSKVTTPNAIKIFSPGADAYSDAAGNPTTLWQDFYPGSGTVDCMGDEVYNGSSTVSAPIQTYPQFLNFYSQVASLGLCAWMTENGAVNNDSIPNNPQQKWNSSIYTNFSTDFPLVKGAAYFDVVGLNNDYHLNGGGLTAFTTMASKSYFMNMNP